MKSFLFSALVAGTFLTSCNSNEKSTTSSNTSKDSAMTTTSMVTIQPADIMDGGVTYKNFVAFDSNKQGKRPGILVVPEWWGLNDYAKNRAKQLAEMGYIALAVDMYGEGKQGADPKEAQALATPFYQNPALTKTRINAALAKLKSYPQTDSSKVAAIGYCYGGFVVLNAAKLGANLNGVVSFHGNLSGVPVNKDLLKAKILVCHGEADSFVKKTEVDAFRHAMDSAKVDYTFKSYPNATHAFTNPASTATGKKFSMPIEYNAAADSASWKDMKDFFVKIF